ncbi:MAG: T9SS type A sorting domain-containing protein [Calditrichaceae bacterium]|nr:YCF48-related protein [Calditrichia bacterium]NUQ40717.1 T9SS type A sorting domain-containing protein [Calditrichaceae bacterium]
MKRFILIIGVLIGSIFSGAALLAQSGWNSLNSGVGNDLYAVHFINPDSGYVAGAGGTVLRTTNGGANWENVSPAGVSEDLNGISVFSDERAVAVGSGGLILLTTDGGANWTPISSGVSDNLLCVSFSGDQGICGGASQTILYSSDASASWNVSQAGFFGGGFWGAVMLSPQFGFVGGENSIFQPLFGKSTDGGAAWDFTAFYLNSNEGRIYGIDFTDINIGYAASGVWTGEGAISRTIDGGANWTTVLFPGVLYGIDFPISNTGLIGFAVGAGGVILKTTNAGVNWQPQMSGNVQTLRGVYFTDLDNGYVVGEGGAILKTTTGGEPPTGVEAPVPGNRIPTSMALRQNYPNPFNPSTTISYYLPQGAAVRLTVYNAAGQAVRTLLNRQQAAGEHTVVWDGRDDVGRAASSGVYLYRLEAGSQVASRKMLLVR